MVKRIWYVLSYACGHSVILVLEFELSFSWLKYLRQIFLISRNNILVTRLVRRYLLIFFLTQHSRHVLTVLKVRRNIACYLHHNINRYGHQQVWSRVKMEVCNACPEGSEICMAKTTHCDIEQKEEKQSKDSKS